MAEIKIISRVIPRGGSGASAPSAGGGFSAPVDISGKLDKSVWNSAFELHYDDPDDPEKLTSIGAKTNFFSVGEISVFGKGGSSGGGGGATTLHMLEDVDLVMPIPDGDVLTYDAEKGRWTNKKGAGGIDTKAMWEELGKSDISKKIDISHIPDLGDKYISLIKLGEVSYGPDKGVISLPAYPTKLSDLKDDVIAGKYLPLTGGTISGNLAVTGHVQIGNAMLKYDAANNAVYVEKDDGSMVNFYATGDLAAFGSTTGGGSGATSLGMLDDVDLVTPLSEGQVLTYDSIKNKWTNKKGGGGLDIDAMWEELAKSDTSKRIHFSHIPDLGSVYAKQVKLGATPYNVSNGVISLPAYPTALKNTLTFTGYQSKSFNGSAAVSVAIPNNTNQLTNGAGFITSSADISGNAGSATKLQTARSLWGQRFDGTNDISGDLYSIGTINCSYTMQINGGNSVGTFPRVLFHIPNVAWAQFLLRLGELQLKDGGSQDGAWYSMATGSFTANGNILASGEITAYSDARLKSCIKPLRSRGFITPVSYIKDGKESIGFIAQDMIELYPELVSKGSTKEHYLSVNYAQYTAVLQAQIIELHKEIDDLKRKFIN